MKEAMKILKEDRSIKDDFSDKDSISEVKSGKWNSSKKPITNPFSEKKLFKERPSTDYSYSDHKSNYSYSNSA